MTTQQNSRRQRREGLTRCTNDGPHEPHGWHGRICRGATPLGALTLSQVEAIADRLNLNAAELAVKLKPSADEEPIDKGPAGAGFGGALRQLREAAGISVDELAATLGAAAPYVARVESNDETPDTFWIQVVTLELCDRLTGKASA